MDRNAIGVSRKPRMACRRTAACTIALLAVVTVNAAQLTELADRYRFAGERLAVSIDKSTGAPVELQFGGRVIARDPGDIQYFDIRQGEQWLTGNLRARPKLTGARQDGSDAMVATVQAGEWQIEFRYRIDELGVLSRSARLTWNGGEPNKLKGFWMRSPEMSVDDEGYYFSPNAYPPTRYDVVSFRPGTKRSWGHSPSPLIAQLAPDVSALWLSDELTVISDRPSVSVNEGDGSLWASQSFNSFALMDPGDQQEIGEACLWLLPMSGEDALRQIHTWMRARGQIPPADRPEWFEDAVIYSFHPGGTIGSGFRDLGGFSAGTKLLDSIADLGANSVWIMPIEDASVYHPRDYYKFQPGLGSADEYRALVSRAHELGLNVLQDCVPHGGRNDYPRAKEHPEWLAYDEDGSTLDYWCFDFNWPTWREYMADVARHYVTQFGVDGYRVDAVSGSRIPNWNPEIPYGRASFAQLQGGLNMLRSLRAAVKESKPEQGGLLAEVGDSIYGAVSDAVYDFRGCYTIDHDLRKLPPEQFVSRLRRSLHEQQYAEIPGLLRLRHVESHDSLRSELWYGPQGQRALLAMTAWVQGIPLVYHEMENGNSAVFRRIFDLRKALPELRRGDADYLSVQAPPEVFACLRSTGSGASIALINFSGERVDGHIVLPETCLAEGMRDAPRVRDMWLGKPVGPRKLDDGSLQLPVSLGPLQFTVYALRTDTFPELEEQPDPWVAPKATQGAHVPEYPGALPLTDGSLQAWIDRETGLLRALRSGVAEITGPADLYLPANLRSTKRQVDVRQEGGQVLADLSFGSAQLRLAYRLAEGSLQVSGEWSGPTAPAYAAMYLPMKSASRWYAASAEGMQEDAYRVIHLTSEAAQSSIYWRSQGTNVIWDSALHPFGLNVATRRIGALNSSGPATIAFSDPVPPRVQWLDRIGDTHELAALIAWRDGTSPSGDALGKVSMTITPGQGPSGTMSPAPALTSVAGGWQFENDHYRLRLGRSGSIINLATTGDDTRTIIDGGDLYTDGGFNAERKRYTVGDDVEAGSRIWREGDTLRMRFEGRLRAFYRFDLLRPPVDYFMEYTFSDAPGFRMSWGVKPDTDPWGEFAFLAMLARLPDVSAFRYSRDGETIGGGQLTDRSQRAFQTRQLEPYVVPDTIQLDSPDGKLLQLTNLTCGGPKPISNVFVHGANFFLTWQDGEPVGGVQKKWQWASAVWTPGDEEPMAVGREPELPPGDAAGGLLQDPGFENAVTQQPVSLISGGKLPGRGVMQHWEISADGNIVGDPVHGGQAAAQVDSTSGAYLLWRQSLPPAKFIPGERWRLTAWVKGEGIERGDVSWKVGTVRFGMTTDTTTYASCEELLGTFGWRQVTAEMTVPENLSSLRVEAGLNGSTGRIWIDDLQLERVQ